MGLGSVFLIASISKCRRVLFLKHLGDSKANTVVSTNYSLILLDLKNQIKMEFNIQSDV